MSSVQRLELRQGQSLALTPQLVQSIRLLQLSHAELLAYVQAELERNPLLQEADRGEDAPPPGLADFLRAKQNSMETGFRYVPGPPPRPAGAAAGAAPQAAAPGHAEMPPELEATLAHSSSLPEHLEAQLDLATADPRLRTLGRHLIHSLDEAGYLTGGLAPVAEQLGIPEAEAEAALRLVQTFDPPGVGARNLAECLEIQLREKGLLDPAMRALLSRLDLVARQDFAALQKLCGVDREELAERLSRIRRLEPKPGLAFSPAVVDVLVPDVLVRTAPDGSLAVELNPGTLPRVLLDRSYHAEIAGSVSKEEDRRFLSDCWQAASWLTRSLDQRARTILAVAGEIVRRQEGFFRKGVEALRPLTLKEVAEAIGMHESTVSRVSANKAIGAERGTYPMKFFFGAATGPDGHAAKAVRHRIRQIIDAEQPGNVLSDEAIVRTLRAEGVAVARRTVAKYREALHIPSSAIRRRRLGMEALRPGRQP